MGFLFLGAILVYIFIAVAIYFLVKDQTRSKKILRITVILLVLFPFKHYLFYGVLFNIYGLLPLQKIHETIESPISVYWEDEVWPGYDRYGRHWMVENYLDGIHLQKLALNGTDGKIYLYTADENSRAESRKIKSNKELIALKEKREKLKIKRKELFKQTGVWDKEIWSEMELMKKKIGELLNGYGDAKKAEVQRIMENAQIFDAPDKLSAMKYHIKLVPIHDWFPINKLYHADLITIKDTGSGNVIAWSKRYMAYAPWIANLSGQQPKFGMKEGDVLVYEFEDKVLFEYAGVMSGFEVTRSFIDRRYYKRNYN